jgi:hypothetical protein
VVLCEELCEPQFIDALVQNRWAAVGAWVVLSFADEVLRARAEKHRQDGAHRHFVRQGPAPRSQARGATFAFVVKGLGGAFFLLMIAVVASSRQVAWLFEATVGVFILTEASYLLGSHQSYWIYRYARDSRGIAGTITYSWWLRVRLGVATLLGFGLLYAMLAVLFGRAFFTGGALGNLALAAYLWRFQGPVPRPAKAPTSP